ncbi:hypothetical protein [uncultured Bacteroides sp.]|nr:hypothetical protein [uncultured Bacteroides sp.]
MEKDREKAEKIYQEIAGHRSSYLMQGEVKMDLWLMDRFNQLNG